MPISAEEAKGLPDHMPNAENALVEILEFLGDQAYTAKEIANHFNINANTVYARLYKLLKYNMVARGCKSIGWGRPVWYWYSKEVK